MQDGQEAYESDDWWCRRSDVEDTIDGADQYSDCEGNYVAFHRGLLVVRSQVDSGCNSGLAGVRAKHRLGINNSEPVSAAVGLSQASHRIVSLAAGPVALELQ